MITYITPRQPCLTRSSARGRLPWLLLASVCCLAGFAMRSMALERQSLWNDDIASLVNAQRTLTDLWTGIEVDQVPLYPFILGGWHALAGTSEFSLRYLSVLFSTLSIPLAIVLGRRLIHPAAGAAAGGLAAVAVFPLYYAQEVKQYSLLGTLGLLSAWAFLRWGPRPPARVIALQNILYAALIYTHYVGIFVLATHIIIALLSRVPGFVRSQIQTTTATPAISWRWSLAWAGGLALFLPWVASHPGLVAGNIAGGTSQPLPEILRAILVEHAFGHPLIDRLEDANPIDALILRYTTLASLLLPLSLGIAVFPRWQDRRPVMPWGQVVAVLHVVVPFALLLLSAQLARDVATRYGYVATVWLPIAAVAGFWRLPVLLRSLGLALLLGYQLWGIALYLEHPGLTRLDFRAAVSAIAEQQRPGDAVIVTAPYVTPTFDYYSRLTGVKLPRAPLPPTIPLDEEQTQNRLAALAAQHERVWHLRWQDYFADPNAVIRRWLEAKAVRLSSRDLGGSLGGSLYLDLWAVRPPILAEPPPDTVVSAGQLGDGTRLVGYQLVESEPDRLAATLFWKLAAPLTIDYTAFLHLLDERDRRTAQTDERPYGGQFPTNRWPVGPLVRDEHQILLNACLPPGMYRLAVGFYDLRTMSRLGSPGNDTIYLPVTLRRPPPPEPGWRLLALLPPALRLEHRLPSPPRLPC